jgi:ATP-dependent 26S proteasome regulatory subunit
MNLLHYKKAAFPAVCVETCEEERFLRNVLSIKDTPVTAINALGGLRDCRTGETIDGTSQYPKAFRWLASQSDSILCVFDFQHIVKNQVAYRSLKECFPMLKDKGCMVVLIAPSWALPAELQHDIPILQFDLPSRSQLQKALNVVADGAGVVASDTNSLLDAAAGLALQEAENAFALSLVQDKALIPATVEREKMRLVKSSGFLEVSLPADPNTIGGLGAYKSYINDEVLPSKGDDLLRVRGVLLVGVPGTGKSACARAFGSLANWPVVRMDFAGLKAGIVGQSESNLTSALKLVDAIAPAILWIDEIEKAVGGFASSAQSDGGTTLGMVGKLLTWMQEHTSAVIVVATCNDYAKLPAELTRAGRFDERFFVDLPTLSERAEIAKVHLSKYSGQGNGLCEQIAAITADWTGAEIEQLVKSAARRTSRVITLQALNDSARDIKPISKVKADEISKLREWAKDTLRLANTPEIKTTAGRKVSIE